MTTRWVLAEVANSLSGTSARAKAADLIDFAHDGTAINVVNESDYLFDRGLGLFRARLDKGWSLTDCISFLVMQDESIFEALTDDHHFEQAGFVPLLKLES